MTTPPDVLYRLIPLTQGRSAIVDAADYEWLNQWKWYAKYASCTKSFYAARNFRNAEGKRGTLRMHRVILGLSVTDKTDGDHINRDTLDNRRSNLRIATRAQNVRNSSKRANNKSGYKGVSYHKASSKWTAQLCVDGKKMYFGVYATKEEAFNRVKEETEKLHGEFARTA